MNLLWQDNVGSFLDSLATDASNGFASFLDGGGSTLWSTPSDGGSFSGSGSLLWSDRTAPSGDANALSFGTGAPALLAPDNTLPGASPLWPLVQAFLPDIEQISAELNSSFLNSLLNGALDVLWTATGGTGQPPVTLPMTGSSQPTHLAGSGGLLDSAFATLAPQHLVWTDPSAVPGLTGQPSFGGAAPTTLTSGLGALAQTPSALPISGVGAHL